MKYKYWFAAMKGICCRRKCVIEKMFCHIQELYNIEETSLKKLPLTEKECDAILESRKTWDIDREYECMVQKGIRLVTFAEDEYPEKLRVIPSPPYALYVKGKLPDPARKSVAIVGARECTRYGLAMAEKFAEELGRAGVQIISGMARGTDATAQRSALLAGGESFAVLGCGPDICYPREEIELYTNLTDRGGVLSEFPIGTKPLAQHFPARNRIISGLADCVLVMEAREKSGSLITADMALEQGKDVYALPGPISSSLSMGCNRLIYQGAGILLSPEMLLEELGITGCEKNKKDGQNKILLETTENMVYSCLGFYPQSLETIRENTGLSVPELLDVMMNLELLGMAKEISKHYYVRSR